MLLRTAIALCLGSLLIACDEEPTPPGTTEGTRELVLNAGEIGNLLFCEGDRCQSLPNPDGCASLVITIDTDSGESCARCLAEDGTQLNERCDGTSFACTLVTAPEPDCVVCAYTSGSVLFSTCTTDAPLECVSYAMSTGDPMDGNFECREDTDCLTGAFCLDGLCQADPDIGECQVCFGPNGNVILNECGVDCSNVGCPDVQCGPGFERVVYPGECCPRCVPQVNCSTEVCPIAAPLPACPPGTALIRDPQDCCGYLCAPLDCSFVDCAFAPGNDPTESTGARCPAGTELSFEFPNCCGACVPTDEDPLCASDADCGPEAFCTNSLGECYESCDDAGNCIDFCFGLCRPFDLTCPDYPAPDPSTCEGEWIREGRDDFGCPLPPVCVCPDGTQSFDGQCSEGCAGTECTTFPQCGPDERLEFGFPYCCGICVPAEECLFEPPKCTATGACADPDLTCVAGLCLPDEADCPVPACDEGAGIAPGPGCCPVCAPQIRYCTERSQCEPDERCTTELGDCRLDPDCESDAASGAECSNECFGNCEPLP